MAAYPDATGSQLGARLAVYKPGTSNSILLGIILILAGVPCTIGGIAVNRYNATVYSGSSYTLEDWLLTAGVVLCLIGIVAFILAFNNRKLRAFVHEQGFVLINKQGVHEIRWDQITQVWHKVEEIKTTQVKDAKTGESTPTTRRISIDIYAVQCANGITCEFEASFYGLSKFGPILKQTYPRYLFPQVLASYRAGNPTTFGTLTVSSAGISNNTLDGPVHLIWGTFNAIEIDQKKGAIIIHRGTESQPWSAISMSETPSIAVFVALVNSIAGGQ